MGIDTKILDELVDLSLQFNPSFLTKLIENFNISGPQLIRDIEAGFHNNDNKGVERAAHKLTSSSGSIGLKELSKSAYTIMEAARSGTVHFRAKDILNLSDLYERQFNELKNYINNTHHLKAG